MNPESNDRSERCVRRVRPGRSLGSPKRLPLSRTDKTDPPWVDREWEAVHVRGCIHFSLARYIYGSTKKINAKIECGLPREPPRRYNNAVPRQTSCHWEPDWPPCYRYEPGHRRYARPSAVHEQASQIERGIRGAWRNYRQRALSSRICVEHISGCPCLYDVMNEETPPDPRHRHFALWDADLW